MISTRKYRVRTDIRDAFRYKLLQRCHDVCNTPLRMTVKKHEALIWFNFNQKIGKLSLNLPRKSWKHSPTFIQNGSLSQYLSGCPRKQDIQDHKTSLVCHVVAPKGLWRTLEKIVDQVSLSVVYKTVTSSFGNSKTEELL